MSHSFEIAVPDHLVARARRGDLRAVEDLVHTFQTPVYTLARRLVRHDHDAEDVLQETLLEMTRSLPRFRGEGSFAGWVRRIATTKALQRLRAASGRPELEELAGDDASPPETGDHGAAASARADLRTLLDRLPDAARVVLWLHEVEGWNHEEIAALMGKTASFSKSQLARAFSRLRRTLLDGGASCI